MGGTALSFGAALPTHTISLSAGNREQVANAAAVEASDKFAMVQQPRCTPLLP